MGRNLGPLNIKDSYEGLVQISGSNQLTDGSGSLIPSLDVTASYATTASYALTTATPTLEEVLTAGNVGGGLQTIILSGSGVETRVFSTEEISSGISGGDFVIKAGSVGADLVLTGNGNPTNYIRLSEAVGIHLSGSVSSKDNITAPLFIGDLQGNADTATSASYALTASYAENATPQSLQSVTTVGNTSTNGIFLEDVSGTGVNSLTVKGNFGVADGIGKLYQSSGLTVLEATGSGVGLSVMVRANADDLARFEPNLITFYKDLDADGQAIIATSITASGGVGLPGFLGDLDGDSATTTAPYIYPDNTNAERKLTMVDNTVVSGRTAQQLRVDNGGNLTYNTLTNKLTTPSANVTTALTASGLIYPTIDGTSGDVLTTDGLGNLTLQPAAGGAAFPYTGSAEISGSLNVVGPIISGDGTNTVGTNGNEASIAGRNNVTTGNIAATVGGEYHNNSAFRGFIGGGEQTTLTGTNVAAMGGYNNTPIKIKYRHLLVICLTLTLSGLAFAEPNEDARVKQRVTDVFSQQYQVQRLLDIEAALARIQADLGIIPDWLPRSSQRRRR